MQFLLIWLIVLQTVLIYLICLFCQFCCFCIVFILGHFVAPAILSISSLSLFHCLLFHYKFAVFILL